MEKLHSKPSRGREIERYRGGISKCERTERDRMIKIDFDHQSYHYRSEYRQLIVEMSCFVDINTLKSSLQTTTSHSKCHRVHIDVVGYLFWARQGTRIFLLVIVVVIVIMLMVIGIVFVNVIICGRFLFLGRMPFGEG